MNLRPFDSWLEDSSAAAAAPIGRMGADRAMGVPEDAGDAIVQEQAQAQTVSGLGASTESSRERIRDIIDARFFDAANIISDALAHQFMSMQEMGELLVRYKNVYGVVRDGPDAGKRCGG